MWYWILQQFNKDTILHFADKNHSKHSRSTVLRLWATWQCFLPEWINHLIDSVDSLYDSDLLPPIDFHVLNIFKYQYSMFYV